ncbi:DUF676 domain-containing protein [Chloropicon roscoffensis]|uniref:DUF676 domain-containing protein n=1 Tax=Chloropicon roscoffensis TaxID=1461544 RepID=A0AAX4NZD8_9CHLO
MNCCADLRNRRSEGGACSGSGSQDPSRRGTGTCCELVLLVGLHNFFNLDLLHRGWFKVSVDLRVLDSSGGNGRSSARGLGIDECEVDLVMDTAVEGSPGSSPEKGLGEHSKSGQGTGKRLRAFCNPFYIEYIEQDVLIQKTVLYRITLKHLWLLEAASFELNFTLHHAATSEDTKPGRGTFTPAASEKITLSDLYNVQQYFVPLHFDKSFLSLTNVSIFASLGGLISERRTSVSTGSGPNALSRNSPLELARSSLDDFETDSWSSFLSLRSNTTPSKDQDHYFGSTITEEDLKREPPEVLEKLIGRLQETLSQLFALESVGKGKQMSGNISEFRQGLMSLPALDRGDPAQLSKEVMKILIELRKLCRFAIMQHTSPAQNMISFLFDHWRASRFRVWSKHIRRQQRYERKMIRPSRGSQTSSQNSGAQQPPARKLSKIDLIHQMYYKDEKFVETTCPEIVTDQPCYDDYDPALEAPPLDVLRLHEFQEVVSVENSSGSNFLDFLGSDEGRPKHIIFFVHGFMGGPQDLRCFHSFLKLRFPHVLCHYSKENFKKTDSSFEDMGRRLAAEVVQVVERLMPVGGQNGCGSSESGVAEEHWKDAHGLRISFVGHSIGNIIIRAALATPEMRCLTKFLWTFLSVSGPHTGFLGVNAVQRAALVFLTKIRKVRSICELSMCDEKDPKDSFLYKLSKKPTFAHFKYVLLLGSKQDGYVPPGSATMTKLVKVHKDGRLHEELVDNFIGEVSNSEALSASGRGTHAYRYVVDFKNLKTHGVFQRVIGRAAHVELLCSPTYIPMFTWCLLDPDMFALPERISINV